MLLLFLINCQIANNHFYWDLTKEKVMNCIWHYNITYLSEFRSLEKQIKSFEQINNDYSTIVEMYKNCFYYKGYYNILC